MYRMDAIVSLELPNVILRLKYIVKCVMQLLGDHLDKNLATDLQDILHHFTQLPWTSSLNCDVHEFKEFLETALGRGISIADLNNFMSDFMGDVKAESLASGSEDATPKSRRGRPKRGSSVPSAKEEVDLAADLPVASHDCFNLCGCLFYFVCKSEGWSYREIEKVVQNMLVDVLSTERYSHSLCYLVVVIACYGMYRCTITSAIWIRQIDFKAKGLHSTTPLVADSIHPDDTLQVTARKKKRPVK